MLWIMQMIITMHFQHFISHSYLFFTHKCLFLPQYTHRKSCFYTCANQRNRFNHICGPYYLLISAWIQASCKGYSNNVDLQITWSPASVLVFEGPCNCSNEVVTSKLATIDLCNLSSWRYSILTVLQLYVPSTEVGKINIFSKQSDACQSLV